jgi:molybdate transport system substrate-binding protein
MNRMIAAGVVALAAGLTGADVNAAELKLLISNGMKEAVHDLAPRFERATGHKLSIRYDTSAFLQRDMVSGESFDVTVVPAPSVDAVTKANKLDPATRTDIAYSRIGIAARKGAPKPDISTVEAFKRTMLNAKAIAYATVGTSGVHFIKVCEQLGIADVVKAKGKTLPGGVLADFVVKGEAELAIQQISELLPVEGVELVGPFPAELQLVTVYVAAVNVASKESAAGKAFIAFLKTPAGIAELKAKGLDPG